MQIDRGGAFLAESLQRRLMTECIKFPTPRHARPTLLARSSVHNYTTSTSSGRRIKEWQFDTTGAAYTASSARRCPSSAWQNARNHTARAASAKRLRRTRGANRALRMATRQNCFTDIISASSRGKRLQKSEMMPVNRTCKKNCAQSIRQLHSQNFPYRVVDELDIDRIGCGPTREMPPYRLNGPKLSVGHL